MKNTNRETALSIIIPVFNSEDILAELVGRLVRILPGLCQAYEIILVNDGSLDGSWQVIQHLCAEFPLLRGINLMRNYGQHNALLCGIRTAHHDIIVTMDDDLQHPPDEIHKLLEKLAEGYDVVYGTPFKDQHGLWRDLASRFTKLTLQNTMGAEVARHVSAFRAFRTKVRDAFTNYQTPYVSIDVLLTWGTARFAAVHVRHDPRQAGVSNYTFMKLIRHAINMTTGFSTLPLRFASVLGFFFTLFGIGVLIYVVGRYVIQGGSPAGFPFLASTIAIFAGAQLFALGIIGEYLARMYFRTMNRPTYVVEQEVVSGLSSSFSKAASSSPQSGKKSVERGK
jgi:undecaprenyl-phosphate 4-deoxy-4-formamido-L-arabinose transferase